MITTLILSFFFIVSLAILDMQADKNKLTRTLFWMMICIMWFTLLILHRLGLGI